MASQKDFTAYVQLQEQIVEAKRAFSDALSKALNLVEVQAPILVCVGDGTQDGLSGVEKAVRVHVKGIPNSQFEVVHSLAKWKRQMLADYNFPVGRGICAHMRALRVEDGIDNVHSVCVDQWDWELVMSPEQRNLTFLTDVVRRIYAAMRQTEEVICSKYGTRPVFPPEIKFLHAERLLGVFPNMTPKERERAIVKQHGAVFLVGIGGKLSDGSAHDVRAADYDDWSSPAAVSSSDFFLAHSTADAPGTLSGLNGDILVYNPVLDDVLELSSMGIRVDAEALQRQIACLKTEECLQCDWHKRLMAGEFPQTIGGGVGQSRLMMLLLQKRHIAEVQCGVWPKEVHQMYDVL